MLWLFVVVCFFFIISRQGVRGVEGHERFWRGIRGRSSKGEEHLHLISIYHYATAQEK